MVKRRESKGTSSKEKPQSTEDVLSDQSSNSNPPSATTDWLKINVPFKNPEFKRSFQHSVVISGKKRQWKALKQILAQETSETAQ